MISNNEATVTYDTSIIRCPWLTADPIYLAYHDTEWGVPEYDDRALFEKLILDGFQAGLSWLTILRKRDGFRQAFDNFDPEKIARYDEKKQHDLLQNTGIIRNKAKIKATISNAQIWLDMMEKEAGFSDFLWHFMQGKPRQNMFKTMQDIPAHTAESHAMSKALRKKGFRFCGPTIVYAFMQACGFVNDHIMSCHCYEKCKQISKK